MRAEFWEISHKFCGIEVRIYDIIVFFIVAVLGICILGIQVMIYFRKDELLKGEYYSNGFTRVRNSQQMKSDKAGRSRLIHQSVF